MSSFRGFTHRRVIAIITIIIIIIIIIIAIIIIKSVTVIISGLFLPRGGEVVFRSSKCACNVSPSTLFHKCIRARFISKVFRIFLFDLASKWPAIGRGGDVHRKADEGKKKARYNSSSSYLLRARVWVWCLPAMHRMLPSDLSCLVLSCSGHRSCG